MQEIDPTMQKGLITRVSFLFPQQYWMGERVSGVFPAHLLGTQLILPSVGAEERVWRGDTGQTWKCLHPTPPHW